MSDSDSDRTSTTLSVCGADDDNEDDESHTVYLNIDSLSDNMENNQIYATINDDEDDKSDTEIEDLRPDTNILGDGSDEDDSLLIIYWKLFSNLVDWDKFVWIECLDVRIDSITNNDINKHLHSFLILFNIYFLLHCLMKIGENIVLHKARLSTLNGCLERMSQIFPFCSIWSGNCGLLFNSLEKNKQTQQNTIQ